MILQVFPNLNCFMILKFYKTESLEQAAFTNNGKQAFSSKCVRQTSWWICRRREVLCKGGGQKCHAKDEA